MKLIFSILMVVTYSCSLYAQDSSAFKVTRLTGSGSISWVGDVASTLFNPLVSYDSAFQSNDSTIILIFKAQNFKVEMGKKALSYFLATRRKETRRIYNELISGKGRSNRGEPGKIYPEPGQPKSN